MKLEIRRCVLTLVPIYTCAGCGAEGRGDSTTQEFTNHLPTLPTLERIGISNQHMPTGWASFYAGPKDEYRCPECLKGAQLDTLA